MLALNLFDLLAESGEGYEGWLVLCPAVLLHTHVYQPYLKSVVLGKPSSVPFTSLHKEEHSYPCRRMDAVSSGWCAIEDIPALHMKNATLSTVLDFLSPLPFAVVFSKLTILNKWERGGGFLIWRWKGQGHQCDSPLWIHRRGIL